MARGDENGLRSRRIRSSYRVNNIAASRIIDLRFSLNDVKYRGDVIYSESRRTTPPRLDSQFRSLRFETPKIIKVIYVRVFENTIKRETIGRNEENEGEIATERREYPRWDPLELENRAHDG